MGCYIETPVSKGKAAWLIEHADAWAIGEFDHETYESWMRDGKVVVCVVENWAFDAAAIAYSWEEAKEFADVRDRRPKTWLLMSRDKVLELAPHASDVL